jgi:hypothetical protein
LVVIRGALNNQSLFLSHNSVDKQYGNVLRNLIVSIGVTNSDIVYTSHEKNKIPVGENIYDYLGNGIEKSNIIFKQGYLLGDASHSFADYVYRLFG